MSRLKEITKKGGGTPPLRDYHGRGRVSLPSFPVSAILGAGLLLSLAGCAPRTGSAPAIRPVSAAGEGDILAPGIVHRAIPGVDGNGMDVIDLDLNTAQAHWTIQTRGIALAQGRVVGQAYTPRDWLTRRNGLAAVNGGYFGGYEDAQGRKDFVGLLVQRGRVRHAAPLLLGQGSLTLPRGHYARSAFGLTAAGRPMIVWAATDPGHPQQLRRFLSPMSRPGPAWRIAEAVGCGPTLIAQGRTVVTDSEERLVSPGPLPRTFVAYDAVGGHPRHLLVGMASGADFHQLAAFVAAYFPRYDKTQAEAAMCLDGGASTQMTYRLNGALQSPRETGVTVPEALVLVLGR